MLRRRSRILSFTAVAALAAVTIVVPARRDAGAQVPAGATERITPAAVAVQSDGNSPATFLTGGNDVAISADGRYVAFTSDATNLVASDTNGATDVFRYDRETRDVIRVSVADQTDAEGDDESGINFISMSADGDRIVFESRATNLVEGDTNGAMDVFVRFVAAGQTYRVSRGAEREQLSALSNQGAISGDGNWVAWVSYADNNLYRTYIGDGILGRQLVAAGGINPSVDHDGSRIAFATDQSLVEEDGNREATADLGPTDVYVADMDVIEGNPYTLVTVDLEGQAAGLSNTAAAAAISADGTRVGFFSGSAALVEGDANGTRDGFVRDVAQGVTWAVGAAADGTLPEGHQGGTSPSISPDGRFAAYSSTESLIPSVSGGMHAYVEALGAGDIRIASLSTDGVAGNASSGDPVLSSDGSIVAFGSFASNLVPEDTNGVRDVFVRTPPPPPPALDGVSLTVAPVEGPAGIPAVDLDTVDVGTLPVFGGDVAAAPLRSAPLRSAPLRSAPLRSAPLRSAPLRSAPLRSAPLRSAPLRSAPLRSAALPAMPLSAVPLLAEGGWAEVLAGPPATPYAGVPLASVTLQQVLALDPVAFPQVGALRFDDIDIAATPLRSASLRTFLFGGPSLDQLSSTQDWCGTLSSLGFDCAAHGVDEATTTLVDLAFLGAPVDDLWFLRNLPVASAVLTASPVHHYDIASVDVAATSLGGTSARDLPVGFVDCTIPVTFDCDASTLADAVAGGHIIDYDAASTTPAILGRLLADPAFNAGLTFADVVEMVVDPAKLSYGDLPLVPLLLGTPVPGSAKEGTLVRYTASATVACDQISNMFVSVRLPRGFRYAAGSASLTVGETTTDPGDPRPPVQIDRAVAVQDSTATESRWDPVPRPELTWVLAGSEEACGAPATGVALSFLAQPWVELGQQTSALSFAVKDGRVDLPHAAPLNVLDAHEPNDDPAQATPVEPGTLYVSHLGAGDGADTFEVRRADGQPLERGSIVTAQLSHLPADFDLRVDGPAAAPLRSAPLRSAPLRSAPLRSAPIEDQGLSGDPAGEIIGPEIVEDVAREADTLSQSAQRNLETEVVSTVVTADTAGQPLTLSVASYLGASSDQPYTLQVFVEDPPVLDCPTPQTGLDVAPHGTLPDPASIDPDTRTLVLLNQQRFDSVHGIGSTQDVLDAFAALGGDAHAGPFTFLSVDGDALVRQAYAELDANPCEPEQSNDVVREILRVSDSVAANLPELRFVVLVGDDSIIPSARVPDEVTIANQREYYPELVFDGKDNVLSAAAGYAYVLTDNHYTDLGDPAGGALAPELAGGRLVETPGEIIGTIQRYGTNPHLQIDRTLVTAYDFLEHGGQETQAALAPLAGDPSKARFRIDDVWTKDELLNTELALKPDVAAVFAHYDHSRLLTAAGDGQPSPASEIVSTSEALGIGLAEGALLFTVGCNAGVNVPAMVMAGDAGNDRLLDWAQLVAQQGGSMFANQGFGYGDTTMSAYSERLMALFAEHLDGTMTVGQAAVAARKAYLAEAPLDVYTTKVLAESTFYGLPFVRVGADGAVGAAPSFASPLPVETSPIATDPLTGLRASSFDVSPTFARKAGARGEFDVASLGGAEEPVLAALYRPLQPSVNLGLPPAPAGTAVGDVLITALSSEDSALADPAIVRPIVDQSAHEPEPLVQEVIYPVSLGGVTPVGTLLLSAGQYRREALGEGTQTRYTRVAGSVLYVEGDALPERPTFTDVEATELAGGATAFVMQVDGAAEQVLVLYKPVGQAEWRSVQLTELSAGSGTWTGGVAGVEVEEYFAQAVKDGMVGSARGKGKNFEPQPPAAGGLQLQVAGTDGANGWLVDGATVTLANPVGGVAYEASVDGGAFQTLDGGTVSLSGTGVRTVAVRGSDGSEGVVVVPLDTTAPTVAVTFPQDGQTLFFSNVGTPQFSCADVGSGIASCAGPSTLSTQLGTHSLTVTATDIAGRTTTHTISYTVTGFTFEGFFRPVDNSPVLNMTKSGSTVPVKFRLRGEHDAIQTDPATVKSITTVGIACSGTSGTNEVDEVAQSTSSSGLRFDSTDRHFVYNWKTSSLWKGTCRQLTVTLTDGTSHRALFQFK